MPFLVFQLSYRREQSDGLALKSLTNAIDLKKALNGKAHSGLEVTTGSDTADRSISSRTRCDIQ